MRYIITILIIALMITVNRYSKVAKTREFQEWRRQLLGACKELGENIIEELKIYKILDWLESKLGG